MPLRCEMEKRRGNNKIDVALLVVMTGLIVIGLLMIYSSSAYNAGGDDPQKFFKAQLRAEVLGAVAMLVVTFIPYKLLRKLGSAPYRYFVLGFALLTVLALLTGLGHTAKGATRWIQIAGMRVQPAEIVKIAVIVYLAGYISEAPDRINHIRGYLAGFGVAALAAGMVYGISSNLSSAIIIGGIAVLMLFVGTKDWFWQILIYLGLLAGVIFVVFIIIKNTDDISHLDFRFKRIMIWRHPEAFLLDNGYQTLQALYAIGSGGFTGKGIGASVQKLGTIPEVHNDMIFSVICEEMGLVGAAVILILFLLLIYRCLRIALGSHDSFGMLLCVGVMFHIAIQVILNILVVTNTIPNTGVSLPFISYGGSSAVFLMTEMGLVQRVARESEL